MATPKSISQDFGSRGGASVPATGITTTETLSRMLWIRLFPYLFFSVQICYNIKINNHKLYSSPKKCISLNIQTKQNKKLWKDAVHSYREWWLILKSYWNILKRGNLLTPCFGKNYLLQIYQITNSTFYVKGWFRPFWQPYFSTDQVQV